MIDLNDEINRKILAKSIMRLLDLWELSLEEQAQLLGFPTTATNIIQGYRNGDPLESKDDLLLRAGLLLGIHKSLRTIYPHSRELTYGWVKKANRRFEDRRPLDVMLDEVEGIKAIRKYLELDQA